MFSARDSCQLFCLFPFFRLCVKSFVYVLVWTSYTHSFPRRLDICIVILFAHSKKVPTASGRDQAEVIGATTFVCLLLGGLYLHSIQMMVILKKKKKKYIKKWRVCFLERRRNVLVTFALQDKKSVWQRTGWGGSLTHSSWAFYPLGVSIWAHRQPGYRAVSSQ